MKRIIKQYRYVLPFAVFLIVGLSAIAVIVISGILMDAQRHLGSQTQTLIVDMTRTENHSTTYQNAAKLYFLNPTEIGKKHLKLLNDTLWSRRNMIQPELFKSQIPEDLKQALQEEINYLIRALSNLSTLLQKPGSLKTEQKEIERNLRSLEASMAYIYTETLIGIHELAKQKQSALSKLSILIVILSLFLVSSILGLVYFMNKLRRQSAILSVLSVTDGLTSLSNRRRFDDIFPIQFDHSKRMGSYVSLFILDVDHFKKYNDTYGHQKGDEALIAIGATLPLSLKRSTDVAFRLGGEEFGCLVTIRNYEEAMALAEKVRQSIANLNIVHSGNPPSQMLTVSVGVASLPNEDYKGPADMYRAADRAMYEAKKSGRNQVKYAGK